MNRVVRLPAAVLTVAVLVWLGLAAPANAGYDEGAAAFIRGDYEVAWQEWLELGKHGHQSAQYNLGVLYSIGLGVEQDDVEATKWFRRAADRGLPAAQMRMGTAYLEGKGVPKDPKEAYFWYTLAATHFSLGEQHEQAVAARESTGAELTRLQITEVLDKAMSWKPVPESLDDSEQERLIAEPNGESVAHLESGSANGLEADSPTESSGEHSAPGPQIADLTGSPGASSAGVAGAAMTAEASATETGPAGTGTRETEAAEIGASATEVPRMNASEPRTMEYTAPVSSVEEAEETAEPQAMEPQNGAQAGDGGVAGEPAAAATTTSGADDTASAPTTTSGAEATDDAKVEVATATGTLGAAADSPEAKEGAQQAKHRFAAHLSSVRDRDGAETEWKALLGQYPDLLDGKTLSVTTIEVADQGTFYRVMAGTFDEFEAAERFCGQLQESEQYCVVRRLDDPSQ